MFIPCFEILFTYFVELSHLFNVGTTLLQILLLIILTKGIIPSFDIRRKTLVLNLNHILRIFYKFRNLLFSKNLFLIWTIFKQRTSLRTTRLHFTPDWNHIKVIIYRLRLRFSKTFYLGCVHQSIANSTIIFKIACQHLILKIRHLIRQLFHSFLLPYSIVLLCWLIFERISSFLTLWNRNIVSVILSVAISLHFFTITIFPGYISFVLSFQFLQLIP